MVAKEPSSCPTWHSKRLIFPLTELKSVPLDHSCTQDERWCHAIKAMGSRVNMLEQQGNTHRSRRDDGREFLHLRIEALLRPTSDYPEVR